MSTYTYTYREDSGHEEFIQADNLDDALEQARELIRGGEWGQEYLTKTDYVEAYVFDEDGNGYRVSVRFDPPEPECDHEDGHDWQTPHAVVGGIEENPGVWGNAGGVIIREVCAHCGRYRVINTWDQSQGPEPVETLAYEDADDRSLEWVEPNEVA